MTVDLLFNKTAIAKTARKKEQMERVTKQESSNDTSTIAM